jgi:predicted metalloprotease with PDZ domain
MGAVCCSQETGQAMVLLQQEAPGEVMSTVLTEDAGADFGTQGDTQDERPQRLSSTKDEDELPQRFSSTENAPPAVLTTPSQTEIKAETDTAPSSQKAVTFQPGPVGLTFKKNGQISKIIEGSQAEQKGLEVGMTIKTVDGQPFATDMLFDRIKGDKDYVIVLDTEKNTVDIKFQPGSVGMSFKTTGLVTKVQEKSQAATLGVAEGMTILLIDGAAYERSLVLGKINNNEGFTLTFSKASEAVVE